MTSTYTLSRSFKSACEPTPEVLQVAQMFGIGADAEHEVVLYKGLEVTLGKGRIVYVTGESGAGKTSLIKDIRTAAAADFTVIDPPVPADKPLVNQSSSLKRAMELMNYAGLAEAFVMLRKPHELSDGQRYRLMLALLMDLADSVKGQPLIILDEFLANLDRETARAVAYQVRKVATKTGVCFVVATTHNDIAADLNADQVITMRLGMDPESATKEAKI